MTAGDVKQAVDRLTDYKRLEAKGKHQEVKGEAQDALGKAKEAVESAADAPKRLGN